MMDSTSSDGFWRARRWLAEDGALVGEVGSSADDLLAAFPELPFVWPELQHGGHGVFLLDAAACLDLSQR
jgi:ribosomal protein L3 glutamine methyltransferase